ncbi:hypothetical protein AVEN_204571-1 [Araneus ventricosus]|uniref:Uncharacterized protein n=1 Tax=Araneus ventricosus TaxID=182803 RepID=A0A4Y2IFP0_ARAVE|nr:hypothetical protein AVEN_204571-1 [Araneus ventricosus]
MVNVFKSGTVTRHGVTPALPKHPGGGCLNENSRDVIPRTDDGVPMAITILGPTPSTGDTSHHRSDSTITIPIREEKTRLLIRWRIIYLLVGETHR